MAVANGATYAVSIGRDKKTILLLIHEPVGDSHLSVSLELTKKQTRSLIHGLKSTMKIIQNMESKDGQST